MQDYCARTGLVEAASALPSLPPLVVPESGTPAGVGGVVSDASGAGGGGMYNGPL